MARDNLKVLSGEGELTQYGNNPMHHFCRTCGVKVFGKGELPDGTKMAAVAVTTLDDLDPHELVQAPVAYLDGRHNRFDREPDFKAHL